MSVEVIKENDKYWIHGTRAELREALFKTFTTACDDVIHKAQSNNLSPISTVMLAEVCTTFSAVATHTILDDVEAYSSHSEKVEKATTYDVRNQYLRLIRKKIKDEIAKVEYLVFYDTDAETEGVEAEELFTCNEHITMMLCSSKISNIKYFAISGLTESEQKELRNYFYELKKEN